MSADPPGDADDVLAAKRDAVVALIESIYRPMCGCRGAALKAEDVPLVIESI